MRLLKIAQSKLWDCFEEIKSKPENKYLIHKGFYIKLYTNLQIFLKIYINILDLG